MKPIEHIALKLRAEILAKPFGDESEKDIYRPIHGTQHAVRSAIWVKLIHNMYKLFDANSQMANLSDELIYLSQIAALYHDSGREDDYKIDDTDHISANRCYQAMLTYIDEKQAMFAGKAILFKEKKGSDIAFNAEETIKTGQKNSIVADARSHEQEGIDVQCMRSLVHDADCLDIIRARSMFNFKYLEIFKTYSDRNIPYFLQFMQVLVIEIRQFIQEQGDLYMSQENSKKLVYENALDPFNAIENALREFPVLWKLYSGDALANINFIRETCREKIPKYISHDEKQSASERRSEVTNLNCDLWGDGVYVRGVCNPASYIRGDESGVQIELRKMLRKPMVPSRKGALDKNGNDYRSCTNLGYGVPAFSPVGFILHTPDENVQLEPFDYDAFTGAYGKKRTINCFFKPSQRNHENVSEALAHIRKLTMLGDLSNEKNNAFSYPEIVINLKPNNIKALYICTEVTIMSRQLSASKFISNADLLSLQALHLYLACLKEWGRELEIYKYSYVKNRFDEYKLPTSDEVMQIYCDLYRKIINTDMVLTQKDPLKLIDEYMQKFHKRAKSDYLYYFDTKFRQNLEHRLTGIYQECFARVKENYYKYLSEEAILTQNIAFRHITLPEEGSRLFTDENIRETIFNIVQQSVNLEPARVRYHLLYQQSPHTFLQFQDIYKRLGRLDVFQKRCAELHDAALEWIQRIYDLTNESCNFKSAFLLIYTVPKDLLTDESLSKRRELNLNFDTFLMGDNCNTMHSVYFNNLMSAIAPCRDAFFAEHSGLKLSSVIKKANIKLYEFDHLYNLDEDEVFTTLLSSISLDMTSMPRFLQFLRQMDVKITDETRQNIFLHFANSYNLSSYYFGAYASFHPKYIFHFYQMTLELAKIVSIRNICDLSAQKIKSKFCEALKNFSDGEYFVPISIKYVLYDLNKLALKETELFAKLFNSAELFEIMKRFKDFMISKNEPEVEEFFNELPELQSRIDVPPMQP